MGVTSWGWEHNMCHRYPGVATRVASFVTWIKENAPAACEMNVKNAGGNMGKRKAGEGRGGDTGVKTLIKEGTIEGNTVGNKERDTEGETDGNRGPIRAAAVLGVAALLPEGATAATTEATLAPTPPTTTTMEEISGKN